MRVEGAATSAHRFSRFWDIPLFAWLLTLHPAAAGRTYAAYGGMYIVVALGWLYAVDGVALTRWDWAGAAVALTGMAMIALQPAARS